jgi:hypothetical protein
MRRSHFLFALAAFFSTPAMAQQTISLEVMVGTVLVDSEAGLVQADSSTVLQAGDRVFLKSGSAALLSNLENGCFISLRSAGQYLVPEMADCTAGRASVMQSTISVIPANGSFGAAPVVYGADTGFAPIAVGLGFSAIVAGAAIYTTVLETEEKVVTVSAP